MHPELADIPTPKIVKGRHNRIRSTRITTSIEAAAKLVAIKKFKLGWGTCRIRLIEDPNLKDVCHRCQEKEHRSFNCTGPDRRGLCFTCHKPGHVARECGRTMAVISEAK